LSIWRVADSYYFVLQETALSPGIIHAGGLVDASGQHLDRRAIEGSV
jgi:hypothetical protein